jgi:hypothetical protein
VPKVKKAFAAQGFGTLTEIDVQASLQAKIAARIEPYADVCHPAGCELLPTLQALHTLTRLSRDGGVDELQGGYTERVGLPDAVLKDARRGRIAS